MRRWTSSLSPAAHVAFVAANLSRFAFGAVLCVAPVLTVACAPAQRREGASALSAARRAETPLGTLAPRSFPAMLPAGPPRPLPPTRFLAGVEDLVVLAMNLPMPEVEGPDRCKATPYHLPRAEADVRAAERATGRRDVVTTFAFGMAFPTSATPARWVETVFDAGAEEAALGADEVVEAGPRVDGVRRERTMRIAMLRMGQGPFRYDFRWTIRVASEALEDGRFLVRYDLDEAASRQRVSYFRGVAVVEPTPAGAFVREVIVAGSPVAPPFFLRRAVHEAATSILSRRWVRLVERSSRR